MGSIASHPLFLALSWASLWLPERLQGDASIWALHCWRNLAGFVVTQSISTGACRCCRSMDPSWEECHARNRSICSCGKRSTYIRQAAGDLAWRSKPMLKFHAVLLVSCERDRSFNRRAWHRQRKRELIGCFPAGGCMHAVGYLALDTSSSV
jgi:hypothetical protein